MMTLLHRCFATILLAVWTTSIQAQGPQTIRFNDAQIQQTGIELQTVGKPNEAKGIHSYFLPGVVVFPLEAQEIISTPTGGLVQSVTVTPPQAVKKGQTLINLYSPQILQWQRDFLQATSTARLASEKLERDRALFAEGIIAESRLQESRAALNQSRVQASENRQMLLLAGMTDGEIDTLAKRQSLSATLAIKARSDGTLLEYSIIPGQQVDAGAPLGKLAIGDKLWVELRATREQASNIRPGDRVVFTGCDDEARVKTIAPQLSAINQTIIIRSELDASPHCLQANQFVEATLYAGQAPNDSWQIPVSAVIHHEGQHLIFIRVPGGFRALAVELFSEAGKLAQIRTTPAEALTADTQVAVNGIAALKGAWMGIGAVENEPADATGSQ